MLASLTNFGRQAPGRAVPIRRPSRRRGSRKRTRDWLGWTWPWPCILSRWSWATVFSTRRARRAALSRLTTATRTISGRRRRVLVSSWSSPLPCSYVAAFLAANLINAAALASRRDPASPSKFQESKCGEKAGPLRARVFGLLLSLYFTVLSPHGVTVAWLRRP